MIEDDTWAADPALAETSAGGDAPAGAAGARYRHYRLGQVLGRGGMGEVVSANDDQIGRAVAIKRMRGGVSDPALVARFVREARIQGQLEHPAIVPVHELGHDDTGAPVIVMKQLRGTTLAEVLRAGTVPRQRLLRAFVDVCLAIELAHSRGIVHRDLKPANIMLGDFGEVYVLDWGIARVLGEQDVAAAPIAGVETGATSAGTVLGTPGYMSPEQQRGDDDLDGRADVFALGKVLAEIVADADAPELATAAARASAPDRDARFPSARALGEVVERIVDGDRDLAQRRKLAATLLADARAALERDDRREAIRTAGRALALDPESADSARLVASLMIEPPATVPAEVERELVDGELRAIEAQRYLGVISTLSLTMLLPLYYWTGLRGPWMFGIGLALSIGVAALRFVSVVDGRRRPVAIALLLILLCAINAWGAYYISALLILPISLIVVTRSITQSQIAPPWMLMVGMLASLVAGSLAASHTMFLPDFEHLDRTALAFTVLALVALTHLVLFLNVRTTVDLERVARRRVHLQAWQLRQLVS